MNLQSIVSFLTSPFGIVILIGAFSTLGRMFKSAQEQQTKKRAHQEMRQAKQDSLRTGSQSSSAAIDAQPGIQSKKANWDQKQQTRKDRIEQLRTQRIEQLKKLRQQRSGGVQPQPTQSSQARSQQPQARSSQPRPINIQQARTPAPPARTPAPAAQAYKRPAPQPYAQPKAPQSRSSSQTPPQQQTATSRKSRPKAVSQRSQRRVSDESRRVSKRPSNSPIALGSTQHVKAESASSGIRAMLKNDLRRAIIAKEVLGPPIGLRSASADLL